MDLRHVAVPDQDVPSDPTLIDAIRAEIRASGPMTFARFMEIALYDPARGYYRGSAARPGRGGDFLTAPEASPIFGRAIARFALALHAALGAPGTFTILEHGAGTGALAEPLVRTMLDDPAGPAAIRYLVAEVEPQRIAAAAARLSGLDAVVTADSDTDEAPFDGIVIANEVLDALPTHRIVQRGPDLREIFVGLDAEGDLVDVEGSPSTPALADRLASESVVLADGQRAEACLAIDAWVARATRRLRRGVLLLIDYGHPARDLYHPRRRAAGTLATYLGHRVGQDPYRAIGRQDLTAHVDVSAVERAARDAGLDHLATTTQAEFLDRLGAGELLVAEQTRPGATMQAYLETRAALVRMIDPGAMGRFRVMAFGHGVPSGSELPGLPPRATSEEND